MGKCITVIKLVGASSLGLLTGSLTYQSLLAIPEMIRRLNHQVSVSSQAAAPVFNNIVRSLACSQVVNAVLTAVSTYSFYMAYKYSAPSGKHPYLIYSALGAPLALVSLYVKGIYAEREIHKRAAAGRAKPAKRAAPATEAPAEAGPAKSVGEDSELDKSYIHLSDDSLSSTPGSSAPGSPALAATAATALAVEPTTSSIEEEIAHALSKKECVKELETVKTAYTVASAVSGAGLAICAIGLVGDSFFL